MRTSRNRREAILKECAKGSVDVDHLAARFGVTASTIRRDLQRLSAQRAITRTYGGAVLTAGHVSHGEESLQARRDLHRRPKAAIADLALSLLQEGERLILDGGSCTFGLESTVVDATGARAVLLRPGALSVDALRRVVPDLAFGAAVAASEAERQSPGQDAVHYAPRAALYVLPRGEAMARAGAGAGLVLRGENLRVPGPAIVRVLPDDPQGFGHALFATLHALDAAGVSEIYVEAPPPGDAWLAVADRLKRGSRGV